MMKPKKMVAIMFLCSLFFFVPISDASAEQIGWITDIHAAGMKKREQTKQNVVYPRKYKEYFDKVLKKLKARGISNVVITGDHTNFGETKYAKELLKIAKKRKMTVYWVKGNHDREKTKLMQKLGVREPFYYSVDLPDNVRMIVLNNSSARIDDAQFEWMKERITSATGKVMIASHISLYHFEASGLFPEYQRVHDFIRDSKKVKLVVSGHSHRDQVIDFDGITYRTGNPLTLKNYMGSYYSIDLLNDFSVSYRP